MAPTTPYRTASSPRPARAALAGPLAGVALCAWLVLPATQQLVAMAQLRGWLPGARLRSLVVADHTVGSIDDSTCWRRYSLSEAARPGAPTYELLTRGGWTTVGERVVVRCAVVQHECARLDQVDTDQADLVFTLGRFLLGALGLAVAGIVAHSRWHDARALHAPR